MKQGSNPFTLWRALKRKLRGEMRVLLTASSVAGLVVLLRLTGLLQGWELAAFDQWVRLRPLEPVDDRIILVGINEADLRKIGKWPIPDAVLAQLLQRLQAYQPRAIGIDLYRDLPVEPGHSDLLKQYAAFNLVAIEQIKDAANPAVPAPSGLNRHQVGFNNVPSDPDGKVRRGMLYWTVEGKTHQSFSLALALMYLKAEGITPRQATDGSGHLQLGNAIFRRFAKDDGSYIRADAGGYQILANLRGPTNRFATVSMTDVLEGRVAAERFRDRIVLIGSTAVSLKDFFSTSYNDDLLRPNLPPMAGVELQANSISQLLSAALEGRSAIGVWSDPIEWFWIWGWSCLGAQLGWRLQSANKSALIILLSGIGLAGISYLLFLQGSWIPLVPAGISLIASAIAVIAHIAHLQEELKRSKEFLNTIINAIPDPIFVKDKDHRWIVLNQAYCKFLGYPLETLLEKSDYDVFLPQEAKVFRQQDDRVFHSAEEYEHEEEFTDRAGMTHYIATKRSLHKDPAGNLFLVGVIRDITERKRMEEELKQTAAELVRSNQELQRSANRLHHQANHDPLTGLPNRKLFYERLGQALEWASENDQLVALLFLDLDGFKLINDTQGHDVGDLLLKAVARRLTGSLRGSDTVSRLGGDEFTVILPAIPTAQDAARVADKILATLAQPFEFHSHSIFVTTSIGISLYPQNGTDVETLVKDADMAMYRAKELGKNCYQLK